jgi:hypothetical protein
VGRWRGGTSRRLWCGSSSVPGLAGQERLPEDLRTLGGYLDCCSYVRGTSSLGGGQPRTYVAGTHLVNKEELVVGKLLRGGPAPRLVGALLEERLNLRHNQPRGVLVGAKEAEGLRDGAQSGRRCLAWSTAPWWRRRLPWSAAERAYTTAAPYVSLLGISADSRARSTDIASPGLAAASAAPLRGPSTPLRHRCSCAMPSCPCGSSLPSPTSRPRLLRVMAARSPRAGHRAGLLPPAGQHTHLRTT